MNILVVVIVVVVVVVANNIKLSFPKPMPCMLQGPTPSGPRLSSCTSHLAMNYPLSPQLKHTGIT